MPASAGIGILTRGGPAPCQAESADGSAVICANIDPCGGSVPEVAELTYAKLCYEFHSRSPTNVGSSPGVFSILCILTRT